MTQPAEAPEPRDAHRLADQITAVFYEACRVGSLDAARQLALALESEVARSNRLRNAERRDDGNDIAAVHARLKLELAKERRGGSGAAHGSADLDPHRSEPS